jgi:inner membrane transporter RhtA
MVSSRVAPLAQVGGAVSVQIGAAVGATIFPLIGPLGVVAARQAVAAVALLVVARPPLRRLGWRALWPALALGLVLVVMNLALYSAVQRVGLGLAVTLEFLGPLAVALLATRRLIDAGFAIAAGLGVVLLTGTVPGIDPVGIGFGLLAAAAWAAYILLNQRVGVRLPGVQGIAIASLVAAVITLPLLVVALAGLAPDRLLHVALVGLAVGVLSSALPYSIDLIVLRRMPRQLFGVLQSVQPAAAAVAGLLILHQALSPWQVTGLVLIMTSNAAAVLWSSRPRAAVPASATERAPAEPITP